jgi:hypothetical protein
VAVRARLHIRGLPLAIVGIALGAAAAEPAQALVAYQRAASQEIVLARNDGSMPRTLGHGSDPALSPDGRYVAYNQPRYYAPGLYTDQLRLLATARNGPSVGSLVAVDESTGRQPELSTSFRSSIRAAAIGFVSLLSATQPDGSVGPGGTSPPSDARVAAERFSRCRTGGAAIGWLDRACR